MSKLTNKQRLFIEEYLTCWNATRAAVRAGYSEKTARQQGAQNLSKLNIATAIQNRLKTKAMSADEVIARLSDLARGSLEDLIEADGTIDVNKVREAGKMHLVKEVLIKEKTFQGVTTRHVKVKIHDAHQALRDMGKIHALFIDHRRVDDWRSEAVGLIRDGKVTYPALSEELGDDLATELFKSAGVPVAST